MSLWYAVVPIIVNDAIDSDIFKAIYNHLSNVNSSKSGTHAQMQQRESLTARIMTTL